MWYRMWVIGALTAAVLLAFVGWFVAVVLGMCVMGAYGVLLPLVYEGKWIRDSEGDSAWLPTGSVSDDFVDSRESKEEGGSGGLVRNILFPFGVVALLAWLAISTLHAN